jgi:DNA-binding response OmpR family regulator
MPEGSAGIVLAADDEAMLLRLVERILSRAGFQVRSARSGSEALEIFRADPEAIDLVLIDAGLPPSGAAETLRAMFALRSGIRVVVVSGSSPSDEIQALLAECGGHFLSKPFAPATLIATLSEPGCSGAA